MARVLVTGGAGFVGSHLVDALVARGDEVVVVDNLDPAAHSGTPDYLNPAAQYRWVDIRERSTWDDTLAGVDVVSHQAGKVGLGVDFGDADAYVDHNVTGWVTGLRAMHDMDYAGAVVLASSMVVYGEGRYRCPTHGVVRAGPRHEADLAAGRFEVGCPKCGADLAPQCVPEDAPLEPRNVYAATKLHQEHLLDAFAREHPVGTAVLRYHNVYGDRMPRDTPYAGVAAIFRSALERGEAPCVTEDGGQMRNFVHVRDVVAANLCAIDRAARTGTAGSDRAGIDRAGPVRAFNVASPAPRSVGDMARALASAFGVGDGEALWPQVTGRYRLGDVRHVFACTTRARDELGYLGVVGFDEGMASFASAPLRAPTPVRSSS